MVDVVGRAKELDSIDSGLGRHSVVLLEGDAGIGKTTIWNEEVRRARARGCRVLTARPAETETKLSLSAVADLLSELPDEILGELPDPQRVALEVALLRVPASPAAFDRRTVATGFRSVLSALAAETPVVVAIDDVQWLDAGSAAVLGFALRRAGDARVGWLLSRRRDLATRFVVEEVVPTDELTRIDVGPLTLGALHHVLTNRLEALSRPLLRQVHQASGGNPLFALEIARLLVEEGPPVAGEPLPIPAPVEELVRRRVRRLPAPTREVLLTAAALSNPREAVVRQAVGASLEGVLEQAERAGIAALARGAIAFFHPLYAAAVYGIASSAERRRAHRRLAEIVEEPEERARHLALAVEGRDEAIAADVHHGARAAFLRGAPAAAAELAELAIRIAEPGHDANRERLYDLAYYLYCASDPTGARLVLEDVDWSGCAPALEARARGLLIELVLVTEGATAAVEIGEGMLLEELPLEARARVLAHLSNAYEYDVERAWRHGEAALEALEALGPDADPGTFARALCWRVRNGLGLGLGLNRDDIERALSFEAMLSRERWLGERISYRFGIWFRHVDELEESRRRLAGDLSEAEAVGDELLQLMLLTHLGLTECFSGHLRLAQDRLEAASTVAHELDSRPTGLLGACAVVEAHLGNESAVRELVAEIDAVHGDQPQGDPAAIQARCALGLLELSRGRAAPADDNLRAALAGIDLAGLREPGVYRAHANAAEAALALGNLADAEAIASRLLEHGTRTSHRWSLAASTRIGALLSAERGDLDGALEMAERAVALHEAAPMAFERARTLLVKGAIERRARQRARAKTSLEEAVAEFDRMEARLWSARARTELARVPIRRRSDLVLTPAETSVAELVAEGKTNAEVAQALFITRKTVEANLTRIYRKLGVRSRAALASRSRRREAGDEPAKL